MERKVEVITYKIYYDCDNCGQGLLMPLGMAHTTWPISYPHVCNNCGFERTFNYTYPRIIYQEIEK